MTKQSQGLSGARSLQTTLKAKARKRREGLADLSSISSSRRRNDILPKLELLHIKPSELHPPQRNVRIVQPVQVKRIIHSIGAVGFVSPVLIDESNNILNGVSVVEAAKQLDLPTVPCIRASHLTASEKRIVRLALNRLAEKGEWNLPDLKAELIELVDEGIEIEDTGFTLPEYDHIALDEAVRPIEKGPLKPSPGILAIARPDDIFVIGERHRIGCADATGSASYRSLFRSEMARMVLTDEPYNVPIAGNVTRGDHREFVMASGEMSDQEFSIFNSIWMASSLAHLCDGGLLGTFIDWRGYALVHAAAIGHGLTPINLCVWTKTNGGMGSLFRSQHELFPIYKKGTVSHVNNVQLGKNGRWRSNVWSYAGASSIGSDSRKGLKLHPTVKPVEMLVDAILDLTNRGDIVLDPFLGSGSTLIAAHETGRRCFGLELDPRYVDVVLSRCQTVYGLEAILESTGETLDVVARRRQEAAGDG